MKRISIITRTKDRPLMLPRALQSIANQTYKDFIWVLVNDAGTRDYVDETAQLAKEAGIDVLVVHRTASTGMEAASNAGVAAVASEFFVIHDDDDSWQPTFLEECVSYIDKHPNYVGVVCWSQAIYERLEGGKLLEVGRAPYNVHLESIQLADMLQQNLYAPISFVLNRSVYDAVGGFDESLPVLGDWDFNLRVLLKGDIGLLPKMLANYHIRESVSSDQVAYGNSITAGENVHILQDAMYRNRKIREDLENGAPGLGFLLCQGRQIYRITKNVDFMTKVFRLPQRAWNRLKRSFRKTPTAG